MAYFKLIATAVGVDAGPFTIKSNTGAILATGVTGLQLLSGYIFNMPAGVTSITVENVVTNTLCSTSEIYTVPYEGYWEMQKSGAELVSDHYGVLSTNYAAPLHSFVSDDVVGVYSGSVFGPGAWTIKAGPEAIGGNSYNGGGTLIVTGHSYSGVVATVESGATLQLGYDRNALTGMINTGSTVSVNAGGTLNVMVANEDTGRIPFAILTNNGSANMLGPDICGKGYMFNQGDITNTSTITLDKVHWKLWNPTAFTGTGFFKVLDGATLSNGGVPIPANQTLQLNGCGKCAANGVPQGALKYGEGSNHTIAAPIQIESETCMKAAGAGTTTFSGRLSGSSKLTLGNNADQFARYGTATFSNATNTFTGALDIDSTTISDNHPLAFQYSDVNMLNQAQISSSQGMTFKSLRSDSQNAYIVTWNVPIILTDNGETTFAGLIGTSSAGHNAVTLDGAGEHLILTNAGNHSVGLRAMNGAKFSQLGGGQIGKLDIETGSKFTVGQTTTAFVNAGATTFSGNSTLEVHAITPSSTGRFSTFGTFTVTGGWKVDMIHPMVAGTYNILAASSGGTGVGVIPTIGVNNTGLTPTFSWSGNTLRVTLA
jgi:hypothetical protein